MENAKIKHPVKTLTAQNDFETRNVCDLNFFDIVSDYSTFHNHDFYEYFLVIEGKGMHLINGFEVSLFRNMLVSLEPSDEHSFSLPEGEKMRILNLAFCKEIALPFVELFRSGGTDIADFCNNRVYGDISATVDNVNKHLPEGDPVNNYHTADRKVISSIYPSHITLSDSQANEIVEQYHNLRIKSQADRPDFLMLKSFFSYLISITILNSSKERKEDSSFPDWLRHSIVGLAEKDNCAQGLSYLIDSTGMNQSYLCRIFRKYMNCTPTEYVNTVRLKNACTLLTYTPRSIVDICFECGFSSVSHFNHLFKKSFDISPTDYRRRSL